MSLPVLELGDDPFERGLAHGRAMGVKVAENVEIYLARFGVGGIDRAAALKEGGIWADFIAEDTPEYFAEMEGIAKGAGVPLRDVAMLNARYEIIYSVFSKESQSDGRAPEPDGCTSFGLMPEVTSHGGTVIGQNWDWLAGLMSRTLVIRVGHEEKPDFVGYTEAGIAGCKMAVNAVGIGLCVNGLVTGQDGRTKYRRPVHVRCRELIEASRMDLALGAFLSSPRVGSANILTGQADGEIFNLELSPEAHQVLLPVDGIVAHANHMKHPGSIPSRMEAIAANTLYRDLRVERALRRAAPRIDLASIREALSDHYSYPASVCRHVDESVPEARRIASVAAIVLDLDARCLHATAGPPCQHPLEAYDLHPETRADMRRAS